MKTIKQKRNPKYLLCSHYCLVTNEPPIVEKVESKKFFINLPINFFSPHITLLTQLPNLPTYLAHFAMAKPIPLLN
jgi:hypothetical protein